MKEESEVGAHVLVRTHTAGVHAGLLIKKEGYVIQLSCARRLWFMHPVHGCSGAMAKVGIDAEKSRLSTTIDVIELTQAIAIRKTTEQARAKFNACHEPDYNKDIILGVDDECDFVGRCVLIRTHRNGVHVGIVLKKDGLTITLLGSRSIEKWRGAFTLSEISRFGLSNKSVIGATRDSRFFCDVVEIMLLTDEAKLAIDKCRKI